MIENELPRSQTTDEPVAPAGPGRRFFEARYWLRDLILSLLLAFIVIVFLYQPVQVEGTSMMPRLTNHERIFINKYLYRFEPIQRGDIVVFWYPLDPTKSYIKRVVGLPGEAVSIRDGRVYVNDKELREQYVPASYMDHQNYPVTVVEPNHFFVLGDHRESSNDSRVWGAVDRKFIYGKAVFVYWPVGDFGSLE
jgi:signal peptidase I